MSEPRYLNVDLVVSSKEELMPIVESFGKDVVTLFNGEWAEHYRAVFEIAGSHAAANEDIGYFCSLIDSLEGKAKDLWQAAYSREFDVGFESGVQGERAYVSVQSAIVKRVAEVGASISITLYPGDPN